MRVKLTADLVRKVPRADADIYDSKYPGLVLRTRASGSHVFRVTYGRGKWITLGRADTLTVDEARGKARDELSAIAKGRDPKAERKASTTFKQFLTDRYEPWALEHHKRGQETVQRLRTVFVAFLPVTLTNITPWAFEKWRTARLKGTDGKRPRPETVNSHLTMLKAALTKAAEWKVIAANPLKDVKRVKADRAGRIRYLTPDEEQRLRAALTARNDARDVRRARANTWRRERGYDAWPPLAADHLRPIVLLALNTGLRKGEIFGLRWSDVDLAGELLTVRGDGAKSGQTRYLPLNREALDVLATWRTAADDHTGFVFPGRAEGEALDDVKKAWAPVVKAARLANFTFHDLRHTFASKLVMAGVDLNTVRELLGHADLKMTLRYAHLAPEHKAAAVAKLVAHGA